MTVQLSAVPQGRCVPAAHDRPLGERSADPAASAAESRVYGAAVRARVFAAVKPEDGTVTKTA